MSKDSYNRDHTVLNLPEREAMLMAMSYSYELSATIYDEYKRLKDTLKFKLPNFEDPEEMATTWISDYKEKKALNTQLLEAKPAIEFMEAVNITPLYKSWGDAAKLNGWGSQTMLKLLRKEKVVNKSNVPYQTYIDRGYFSVKTNRSPRGHLVYTGVVSGKGVEWLSRFLKKHKQTV